MATANTIGELYNNLSASDKETVDIVIAAATDGVSLYGTDVAENYKALPEIQKHFINFVVGNAAPEVAEHSDVEKFLTHFGVKGMKWGVRNDNRSRAANKAVRIQNKAAAKALRVETRGQVKAGTATLGAAHNAALKSKGHRITNGFLGDKTFWRRTVPISLGIGVVGGTAAVFLPLALPTAVLTAVGTSSLGSGLASIIGAEAAGLTVTAGIGSSVANAASVGTAGVGYAKNAKRAITGNKKIRESHEALGKTMLANQKSGSEKVQKLLVREGGLSKKNIVPKVKHSDVETFLAHFGIRGMKWGVRRTPAQLARNAPASEDAINAVKTQQTIKSSGSLNTVSSKELQNLVNRMNLEQQYVRLTTDSTPKKADSFVKKLLKNEGESLLIKGKKGPVLKALDSLLVKESGTHRK